jgi:isocitrate lyase
MKVIAGDTLERRWATESRWQGIRRTYSGATVSRLQSSLLVEHTLARHGAQRLWHELQADEPLTALGTLTGNQAVQAARAGLRALYCSGWQVAADANVAGEMYPDQSLYPANSVPAVVERLNNALTRLDQIESLEDRGGEQW